MEKIKYLVSGDCTVCVEFGNEISPEINRRIRAFKIALEKEAVDGVVETIPTYRSLSVVYRPEVIRFGELTKKFDAVLETMTVSRSRLRRSSRSLCSTAGTWGRIWNLWRPITIRPRRRS